MLQSEANFEWLLYLSTAMPVATPRQRFYSLFVFLTKLFFTRSVGSNAVLPPQAPCPLPTLRGGGFFPPHVTFSPIGKIAIAPQLVVDLAGLN